MAFPKVSIITVVRNGEKVIGNTIESVFMQDSDDYEFIIIDGKSTDRTLEIIKSYRNGDSIRLISEEDNGIYDAMNKGVRHARGEYVFFLNAGDLFFDEHVISEFVTITSEDDNQIDIYYGDVMVNNRRSKHPSKLRKMWMVYREGMICHQSIFSKRCLYDNYMFDTAFKICADRDWLIFQIEHGAIVRYLKGFFVALYDDDGVSSYYDFYSRDSLNVSKKYGGNKAVCFIIIKRKVGELLGHKRKWKNK